MDDMDEYNKLQVIDDSTRSDCYYLDSSDDCYYFGIYTAKKGYNYSEINQLISNLKKSMDRRSKPEWKYKENAIDRCIHLVANALENTISGKYLIVPVPPSKAKNDALYDDRMLRIASQAIALAQKQDNFEAVELVEQISSRDASHISNDRRPDVEELQKNYRLTGKIADDISGIIILDDVLTTGCHFKAIKSIICEKYPNIYVCGLFIAKTRHILDFEYP